MSNHVVVLKLTNGDDVICRVQEHHSSSVMGLIEDPESEACSLPKDGYIIVTDAHQIVPNQVGPGQMSISLLPWALGNFKGTVRVQLNHVLAIYHPEDNLNATFLKSATGIALPEPRKILK